MYKEDVMTYKRVNTNYMEEEGNVKSILSLNNIFFYTCAFFASRVIMLKMFMPFGLAFFISAYGILGYRAAIITGVVTGFGYITASNGALGLSHAVTILISLAVGVLIRKKDNFSIFRISIAVFIINTIMNIFVYKVFISGEFIPYDIFISVLESGIAIAFGFISSYGVPAFFPKNIKENIANEELICLALMVSIAVAGTFDISYMGISLKNLVAFLLAISCGFNYGASFGAAIGITLGLISGIADTSMPFTIGIFGFCGLISGVFKDFGKILTSIAFILSAAILSFYVSSFSNGNSLILDAIIAVAIFLIIPKKFLQSLSFANICLKEEKVEVKNELYIKRVNDIMSSRLSGVSTALDGLSNALEENFTNELSKKADINAMVEKLANKVCFTCENRNLCWNSEIYYTTNAFVELLQDVEKRGKLSPKDLPNSIESKCLKPYELTRETNSIFEIFRVNSIWKNKLANSRVILAEQIRGMSLIVNDMIEEAANIIEVKSDKEKEIEDALRENNIKFSEVFLVKDIKGRYEVTVYIDSNYGNDINVCDYTSIISLVLDRKLCTTNLTSGMVKNSIYQIKLIEEEKYTVKTAIAKSSSENISGDSYTFGDIGSGRYLVGLSDGMGSGVIASNESKATISLLEKFMEAGFDRSSAIKAINSVLILGDNDERFATIDMCLIDLYSGIGEFVKIGAAPTYIKKSDTVEILKSSSMPVGILDDVDFETNIIDIENGDMIIMVSDGVSDANENMKETWVSKALYEYDSGNPKDVADYILKKAKEYAGEDFDDMTVVVSKVWKII